MKQEMADWFGRIVDGVRFRRLAARRKREVRDAQRQVDLAEGAVQQLQRDLDEEKARAADLESHLSTQVRELEETIKVNKITIENLTIENSRNHERLRAETAIQVSVREAAAHGGASNALDLGHGD